VRIIRPGSRGADVHDVQQRLVALGHRIDPEELDDGNYDATTTSAVRTFQTSRSILIDGIVGPETWAHLVEAGYRLGDRTLYLRYPFFRGDDVRELQRRLNGLGFDAWREDGIFGEHVDRAVREFQRNIGETADGIVGPGTFDAFARLRADPDAPSRAMVRETEELRAAASLDGAVIAVDAGHGADETGAVATTGLTKADASFAVATLLVEEFERRGARPKLLRAQFENPTTGERAASANALGAAVCVSIHLNDNDPPDRGAAAVFFGTEKTHSPAGRRLAELILGELGSRMGMAASEAHPMAITLLRETRMPAVQIEPCSITDGPEAALLGEPGFQRDIAVAIAIGVERFLGGDPA
jgi:N-acetylmuramoyl-L-alanine amidase